MKERPILFNAPMVRALLAGMKTQTRRVSGLDAINQDPDRYTYLGVVSGPGEPHYAFHDKHTGAQTLVRCRSGQPGDRLWVREAHYLTDNGDEEYAVYATDSDAVREHLRSIDALPAHFPADVKARHRKLRPSIHMPRWASRINLEITSVRVERLQDISEADALAEGCTQNHNGHFWGGPHQTSGMKQMATALKAYQDLWESINDPGSWDANPWVWVVEFRRLK